MAGAAGEVSRRQEPPAAVRVEAVGVGFAYDDRPVLAGADLVLRPGVRMAMLGANGSGKTTLLRLLAGSLPCGSGEVLVDGRPLRARGAELRHHRQLVQLVLQDPDDQLFSADVRRDVSFGPVNLGLPPDEVGARVHEALELLGITDLADRPVHRLSYGQRKRVAIAGAVAMRPAVLLLDEPVAGLDPVGIDEMLAAVARLEAAGTTVLIATHDVDFALDWAQEAAVVTQGRVVQGDPVAVLGEADLVRAARLRMPWALRLSPYLPAPRQGPAEAHPRRLADVVARLTAADRD